MKNEKIIEEEEDGGEYNAFIHRELRKMKRA